ncbi:hypothetical protein DFJ73DRAFT_769974 [Zopfochytrium polystomum]|nr:hypothetical protein DFJ73DRAFT_769974 [Zopfochytrium polystomum]
MPSTGSEALVVTFVVYVAVIVAISGIFVIGAYFLYREYKKSQLRKQQYMQTLATLQSQQQQHLSVIVVPQTAYPATGTAAAVVGAGLAYPVGPGQAQLAWQQQQYSSASSSPKASSLNPTYKVTSI